MLKALLRRLMALPGRAAVSPTLEEAAALLDAGRLDEAEPLLRRLSEAMPHRFEPRLMLGRALYVRQRYAAAAACLEQAVALEPRDADAQYLLGRANIDLGELDEAADALSKAVALEPASAVAWLALGDARRHLGRLDAAEDDYRQALDLFPSLAPAAHNYAILLDELGRADEAIAWHRRAIELDPGIGERSSLLFALNRTDAIAPEDVYCAHVEWARRCAEPLTAAARPHARGVREERRLRVGYVSPDFRDHAVTYFFEPVLENHDARAFSIYCYSDVALPDARTERLRRCACTWRDTVAYSDAALADLVRGDAIDILVDLAGHTRGGRLLAFARRPAPVQITWGGYPNTTGMSAMDYRITDAFADPPGTTEQLHSEELLRMPETYVPFARPDEALPVVPPPAIDRGYVTFGSFNAAARVTPRALRLWARLLRALPASRLLMLGVPEGRTQQRIRAAFSEEGVEDTRVDLHARLARAEFLAAHQGVDVALDTYPWNGTTTTAHTLWMGIPVVTLAGRTHASRVGLSMLSNAGLPGLAATSEDGYVAAALEFARDVPRLAELRATLRERMEDGPNMDGPRFTRFLEATYFRVWDDFCAGK